MVVIEEEDTTKELKRLESTLSTAVKQIKVCIVSSMFMFVLGDLEFFIILLLLQGIARTTKQRRQLINRMEPLVEENEKLKEALKLMEKNI